MTSREHSNVAVTEESNLGQTSCSAQSHLTQEEGRGEDARPEPAAPGLTSAHHGNMTAMFIPLKNVPRVESQVSGEHCHGD